MRRSEEGLEPWLDRQYRYATPAMLESISPVGIVKTRPGFGQTVHPLKGSIVASRVLADWNPEPDYFFHWYRDSALVMDALRVLVNVGSIGKNNADSSTQDLRGQVHGKCSALLYQEFNVSKETQFVTIDLGAQAEALPMTDFRGISTRYWPHVRATGRRYQ